MSDAINEPSALEIFRVLNFFYLHPGSLLCLSGLVFFSWCLWILMACACDTVHKIYLLYLYDIIIRSLHSISLGYLADIHSDILEYNLVSVIFHLWNYSHFSPSFSFVFYLNSWFFFLQFFKGSSKCNGIIFFFSWGIPHSFFLQIFKFVIYQVH